MASRAREASPVNGQVPPPEYRWKKGQSGNPGGRPKGYSPTAALLRILAMEDPEKFRPRTGADHVAWSLYMRAVDAEKDGVAACRTALERADGAVPQAMDLTHREIDPDKFLLDLSGRQAEPMERNGCDD